MKITLIVDDDWDLFVANSTQQKQLKDGGSVEMTSIGTLKFTASPRWRPGAAKDILDEHNRDLENKGFFDFLKDIF